MKKNLKNLTRKTQSKFLKVECPKCKAHNVVFGKATSTPSCMVCGEILAYPTGGKSRINGKILEIY